MIGLSTGDRVVIRFGQRQGQSGEIIQSQPAKVYKVRVEDGSCSLFH